MPGQQIKKRGALFPVLLTALVFFAILEFLRFGTFLAETGGAVKIQEALWVPSGGEPKKVRLPHSADDENINHPERRSRYVILWPQEKLAPGDPDKQWGILLPRAASQFRVLVNEVEIDRVGWASDGLTPYLSGTAPHMVMIPPWVYNTSEARPSIEIEVAGFTLDRVGISSVWVGEIGKLRAYRDRLAFWQNTITGAGAIFGIIAAILTLYASTQLNDKKYHWLLICSALFGARSATLMITEPLVGSYPISFALDRSLLVLIGASFVITVKHFLQARSPQDPLMLGWISPVTIAVTITSLLLIWLSALQQQYIYTKWAAALMLAVSTAAFSWAAARFILKRSKDLGRWPIIMGALFVLICGARDFLAIQIGIGGDGDFRWMTAGSLVLLIIMTGHLAARLAASSERLRRMADSLDEQARQREHELRIAYEELRARDIIEHRQKERRAIMRNLHDGLGALLSSLGGVIASMPHSTPQKACAEDLLRQSINTLQLTLDSMEPHEGSVSALMGMARRRLWDAIRAHGIEFEWKARDVPSLPQMDNDRAAQEFLMLISETFQNIIKHSGASRLSVYIDQDDHDVLVRIQDDGQGISWDLPQSLEQAQQQARGRGLVNMFERAQRCGATLRLYHASPGLGVEIRFAKNPSKTVFLDSAVLSGEFAKPSGLL